MSCDDPAVQSLRHEIKQLKAVVKELRRLRKIDSEKVDRYDWIEANAKEVYIRPELVNCDWAPDIRTKWEIPTLICSGPVGGMMSFGESIDVQRKNK